MTGKIRVAHVITRLCKGGAQENTFHTVRLANRDRYDVDLISGPTHGPEGSIEGVVAAAGIPIERVPALLRPIRPDKDGMALGQLIRRFQRGRYDIVHTHTSKAGILGRLAARIAGIPIVVHTPHGNIFDGYFSPAKTRLFLAAERMAARWTDRIIELTPGGIEEHLEKGIGRREQFLSIFSGIDLERFADAPRRRVETRKRLGVSDSEFLVGGVGRLEPVKGFSYFMDAARVLTDETTHVRFVHVGDGSEAEALRRLAADMSGRVTFLGLRDDIPDLMAAFDALVVPSLNEGMGRVILEAGAVGTPVVASRVGGIPDVVNDGETGLLVQPRDTAAIVESLRSLAINPARARELGEKARTHIVPEFGVERMVVRIEALYEELLEAKRVGSR